MMISIEYIAGVFDGEGSIGCYQRTDNNSKRWQFAIINTHWEMLSEIQKVIGGGIYTMKRYSPKHAPCWQLQITGWKRVYKVLGLLFPFLIAKHAKVEVAMMELAKGPPRFRAHSCNIQNCGRPHLAKGLCVLHYARKKREIPIISPVS